MSVSSLLIDQFAQFLGKENVSANTYKNYLSDIRHFSDWVSQIETTQPVTNPLDELLLSSYRDYLSVNCPVKTANRRLSSLRKFCYFLASIGYLPSDPSWKLTNVTPPQPDTDHLLLARFAKSLQSEGASIATVNNYLSDARDYLKFKSLHPEILQDSQYETYINHQVTASSPATAKRRVSSIKKFLYLTSLHPQVSTPPPPVYYTPVVQMEPELPTPAEEPVPIDLISPPPSPEIPLPLSSPPPPLIPPISPKLIALLITSLILVSVLAFFLFRPKPLLTKSTPRPSVPNLSRELLNPFVSSY
ncbi:hypothetical protein A2876_03025 [Candidatus Amesbacteria bacterium RIFCSPHIGHO2_01_FULL_48_32b]|uniref:Core-binding (CB) domain-containing protein n=1 Tax=Candidatus Amesbacteria bacterium RIFCSPHIGHO2_01_FULL_48_32b TaxID=1797253 RepID=A0A1F4YF57_9BACT|nr:MAG: hypothetical protein A2876_03025 [Candidatus Amesbacteria bacterium RIFCSPHIGHO2_01_FULL_48_32b]